MQHLKLFLATVLVIGSVCYSSAFRKENIEVFTSNIEHHCYNHSEGKAKLLINGQDYPLAHTLENFISLVEKFEAANPDMKIEDTLFIFLRNFTHENLFYQPASDDFFQSSPTNTEYFRIASLWAGGRDNTPAEHVNPFDENEICSLYYMLSHTVNDTARVDEDDTLVFSTPSTTVSPPNIDTTPFSVQSYIKDGVLKADEVKKTKQPREQGIVLVRRTGETISLGQVILGLYSGLTGEEKPLSSYLKTPFKNIPVGFNDVQVIPLYILTLSDTLLLSQWLNPVSEKPGIIAGNAEIFGDNNRDVGFGTNVICPTVFKLKESPSLITYSLIRGSIDGLLLGSVIKDVSNSNSLTSVRLSQVLQSYYSPLGIHIPAKSNGNSQLSHYSSCNRATLLAELEQNVKQHMDSLSVIISSNLQKDQAKSNIAWETFTQRRNDILAVLPDQCTPETKVEKLPCETPVDIIIVLDTTNGQEEIKLQQEIVGYMATELQLHNGISTATVYLDHMNDSSSTYLEELVPHTYSSACIACHVVQKEILIGSVDRTSVLLAIDQILADRKSEEEHLSGAPGKVVVFFNFKDTEAPDSRLDKVIHQTYQEHSDVTFIAVGKNEKVLQKYAGQNMFNMVRLVKNEDTKSIGTSIAQKICLGPASLQYYDCKLATDEKNAVYEGYVTESSVQHWGMDTKYFEKSFTAKLFFESFDGYIKVCHNRASTKPELLEKNCHTSNSTTRRLQFTVTDPCKGLSRASCPSMYFSVIGVQPKEDDINNNHLCTDADCKSFNQVKFKFTHEGVRCNGCSALLSNSVLLLVSVFLAYVLCTK